MLGHGGKQLTAREKLNDAVLSSVGPRWIAVRNIEVGSRENSRGR